MFIRCQQPKLDLFNTEKIALQTNYLFFCEKTGFIYEQNKIDKPGNIKAFGDIKLRLYHLLIPTEILIFSSLTNMNIHVNF